MLWLKGSLRPGCLALAMCCFIQAGTSYYFEKGFDHLYTYSSRSDLFGMHHFSTIMKFRIRPVNSTDDMHSLMLDSFVQHSEDGYIAENPQQWDLSKRFYFRLNNDGTVAMVHYDHADDDEVIALKKVLTSTLSAKSNIYPNHPRVYVNREVDHTGDLEHEYNVSRGSEGIVLRRSHKSTDRVHRNHSKIMHYSQHGTVKFVLADDTIRLRQSDKRNVSSNAVNAVPIQDWSSGEFPSISSNAVSKLRLTQKRPHAEESDDAQHLDQLINGSLLISASKTLNKTTLQQMKEEINTTLTCIQSHANKHAANRTACVRHLRSMIMSLQEEDYHSLATSAIGVVCYVNDTTCADQRSLFIDIIGRKGDPFSQRLLMRCLPPNEDSNEKEAFRILFHFINLKKPIPELVLKIEHLCFGKDNELHGSDIMTKTQRRACLTLGSLVKVVNETDPLGADIIIAKMEAWLGLHNETKSSPILRQRRKRSVTDVNHPRLNHIVTKMVFINSLGNSGMERSLDHILSYLQPNMGTSAWRRSAILSLRHYTCHKSAIALLHSALNDEHDLVKEISLKAFTYHPRGQTLLPEHYDMVLTRNYSYPALMRLKRGIIDIDTTGGFRLAITIPGIHWEKTIGTADIGAGFGLHIRNRMELELKPLQGHFLIDVYDTAFVEAYCGLLNIHVDIFKALVCYNGHIGYDLNVLKDFGINNVQDLVNIFDTIMKNTVDPIKRAVNNFKNMVQMFKDGGIQHLFNSLVLAVKNLPQVIKAAADKFVALMRKVADFGGRPWLDDIKRLVIRVKTFLEDVRDDIMEFYNTVVDAVTVTLPYVGKQLMDSIATLISAVKSILSNPLQAMSGIGQALMKIKMAISMFLDVKNQVLDACFFMKGKTPYWMTIGNEVAGIVTDLKDIIEQMSTPGSDGQVGSADHHSMTMSDGIQHMEEQAVQIKAELIEDLKDAIGPLETIFDVAKPVIDTFRSVMDVVQGIKSTYEFLRDMVIKVKSMIQKIFGPKFNIKFPTRRREENVQCGQGVWPTTTAGMYKTTGVDVYLNKGSSVRCPVNGMVYRKSSSQLLVQPSEADFLQFEIVIDNVEANRLVSDSGTFFESGKKIGKAKRSKCSPNFIHVAMRKRTANTNLPDEFYEYVDPSPYLDRLVPIPQWIEECNEMTLIIMNNVIEVGALDEKGAQEEIEEVDSTIKDDDINQMDAAKEPQYTPNNFDFGSSQNVGGNFLSGMKDSLSSFSDLKNMFSGDSMKIPNILDIVDLKRFTLSEVTDILSPGLATDFKNIIQKLDGTLRTMPSLPAGSFSIPQLRNVLGNASKGIGDKYSMISKLFSLAENSCPSFRAGLNKGLGHVCQAHADCLGLSCELLLPYGSLDKMVSTDISVNPCDGLLQIAIATTKTVLNLDGHDNHIPFFTLGGLSAELIVNGDVIDNVVILTVEVTLCHDEYLSCIVPIKVATDMTFPQVDVCHDFIIGGRMDGHGVEVEKMTLGEMILAISQNDVMNQEDMELIGKIRDAVVSELFKNPNGFLQLHGEEFQDKIDFCVEVDIPIEPLNVVFFEVTFRFFVGPVPLSLAFGAGGSLSLDVSLGVCFLSMTAKVTVTPGAGGSVWGIAALDLGFARGGIKLIGYILETKFPVVGSIGFSKFPLDVTAKMDLILVPLKLDLRGFAELNLLFTTVTVFDASLWTYTAPTIKRNIFTTPMIGTDPSPPEFPPHSVSSERKRSTRGCLVQQVKFRNPLDAAFNLEVSTLDETSQITLFYAIGTQPGGTNIVDWTEMGGASLLVPTNDLPSGIPLYWTVKATNTQGLEAFSYCMLPTYDTTIPDGRIDPSYQFSSHPNKLSGTAVVFDDSTLENSHEKAVGFSSGEYGSELVPWESFDIDKTSIREGVDNDLKYFSVPRTGKLTAVTFKDAKTRTVIECAKLCMGYSAKCVSFDYEYHSETCELHEVVEGPRASLRQSGTYKNYERLGVGHSSYVMYDNLDLCHATVYYINAKISNTIGYTAYITSIGTTMDFTPPFTGPLGTAAQMTMQASRCFAAVTQRCIEVTWKENHRIIIDDKDSRTVFNGHEPLQDELYTINNHLASVNFDGFHDDESGIWGYTWMMGESVCTQNIVGESDPHEHFSSKKYWTHNGYEKNLHLQDGAYYVTVRALNNVVFGGALVTTVCHSTPFTIDTTPPIFTKVLDIFYDEDFDLLAVYFNASDSLSHLARVDFGLGKTKHDVKVRGYELQAYITREEPFVAVEHLGLGHGIPAWLRLRAVNNVGLYTARHGDQQILIDLTPPNIGLVLDGNKFDKDVDYQADTSTMCAQWVKFYDEESGIKDYIWGVGTSPEADDVVKYHNLTHHYKRSCAGDLKLKHNKTYFSTVKVYNAALNSKESSGKSDGVLIDITPPLPGAVLDGARLGEDINFSSETARKSCNWNNFTDRESHIARYDVSLFINREHIRTFELIASTGFTERSIVMNHLDEVEFVVKAVNGAELTVEVMSDGFLVDHTTPMMTYIRDTETGKRFQNFSDHLDVSWLFEDGDSGIKEYRYFINEQHQGGKHKSWPENVAFETTYSSLEGGPIKLKIDHLTLVNGAMYTIVVTAINNALLSTSHESFGVIIDATSPLLTKVHVGLPKEEEDVDELNRVLHVDPNILTVSWVGQDPESGIDKVYLGIGTTPVDLSITGRFIEFGGNENTLTVKDLELETFSDSNTVYYVSVKAINGAGLESNIVSSKPIILLKANIPGQIFDGRHEFVDDDYSRDKGSLAITFAGFQSDACDIRKYEWAIGTDAYKSDVLPYTGYGLMVHNSTHGQAQIHMDFTAGETYYVTVRAQPGHNCHEEYIVSSSDGIKLDTSAPEIHYIGPVAGDTHYVHSRNVFYQSNADSLVIVWNVSDDSAVSKMSVSAGSLPALTDVISTQTIDTMGTPTGFLSSTLGFSTFLTLQLEDLIGNRRDVTADPVIADVSPPMVRSLNCTEAVSLERSSVHCSWQFVVEEESAVKSLTVIIVSPYNTLPIKLEIPQGRRHFIVDVIDLLNATMTQEISIYITVSNILSQNMTYVQNIKVDNTPPSSLNVKVVTKMSLEEIAFHQRCQIPQTFIDVLVENPTDEETGIEKIEVAIGSSPGKNDIHHYLDMPPSGKIFFGNLDLGHGVIFHATARVTNKAGLSKMFYSDSVTVSVRPILTVGDGSSDADEDYQSNLNVIKGFWRFSDTCVLDTVLWKVEDILGNVIKEFEAVAENAQVFYNDEFTLKNGFTYINIIKVKDALNRTFTSASDGITIRIQPPNPGNVRDGLYEDTNYQQTVEQLSANWDKFGDSTGDPTQTIRYYEVAIGDDNRYPKSRSNIHYYVDVGLNRSHTFRNLNLTALDVTYYITVRGISVSGSQDEASSNGIKVGFEHQIVPGLIETPAVQSDISKITASWTEFQSDIGIKQYLVGVCSSEFKIKLTLYKNETAPCGNIQNSLKLLDEKPMSDNGLNTLVVLQDLYLKHDHVYYVIVVAVNEADMCRYVTSQPILIDTTPPYLTSAVLYIGRVMDGRKDDIFIDKSDKLDVKWENVTENESSIASCEVTLYEMSDCSMKTVSQEFKIDSILVKGDNKITLYQLILLPNVFYFIEVTALNTAGLKSSIISSRFRLDVSAPLKGDVKIGTNWFTPSTFQSSTETITSWIAIARSYEQFVCPNQMVLFPSYSSWVKLTGLYSPEFVEFVQTKATLTIGYNTAQTKFLRSGMQSSRISVLPGNYTVSLKAASGLNIITIISFASEPHLFPTNYTPPHIETIDEVAFNMTIPKDDLEDATNVSTLEIPNSTTTTYTSSSSITPQPDRNVTTRSNEESPNSERFGFGLSIMGTQQHGSDHWDAMFWVVGQYKSFEEWITLDIDPSESEGRFIFSLETEFGRGKTFHNIKLIVNGVIKAMVNGIAFGDNVRTFISAVNDNDFEPPIEDMFEPFRSEVVVTSVQIPTDQDKLCLYGCGFFDGESNIKEIWVGISDSYNSTDNIFPMKHYETLCLPCEEQCLEDCQETCQFGEFDLMKIELTGLNLLPTIASTINGSENEFQIKESHTYYVTIEVVNFAGQTSFSRSNGIMVDTTPAVCEYVRCLDPDNSMDEPTEYVGTTNSVAAYWSCSDTESEVYSYSIGVGTSQNIADLYNMTHIGLATKAEIHLENGNIFKHGNTYYFNVWAYNAAGLPGKFSCKFTVELHPPDVKNVLTKSLFEYQPTDESGNPIANVSFTEFEDSFGVTWNSADDIAGMYEWGIGTGSHTFDILPIIRVGVTKTGQAEIIDGHLWFNGQDMNSSVSMLCDEPNDTTDGSLFMLEPGRCFFHSLVAVGRSHLRSSIPIQPTCITRPSDIRLVLNEKQNATLIMMADGSMRILDPRSEFPSDVVVVFHIQASHSGIMMGYLRDEEVTKSYGTDASAAFSSYIVDPKSSMMYTTRLFKNRFQAYQGLSFFISPMPFIEYSDFEMTISVKINETNYNSNTVPALALWSYTDSGNGKWLHVQEECDPDSISEQVVDAYLTTKVCLETLISKVPEDNTRPAREATSDPAGFTSPYQFALFEIERSCVNTAPTITTDVIYTTEDTPVVRYQLSWFDEENDGLVFSSKQPTSGQLNVTTDGLLTFLPSLEFSGEIQVEINAEETSICDNKHSLSKFIIIHVGSDDDAPKVGFLSHDDNFTLADHLNADIVIFLEGSSTEHDVGSVLIADADLGESLSLISRTMIETDAVLIQEEPGQQLVPNNTFTPIQSRTFKRFGLTLETSRDFHGHLHYQLLGSDRGGQMTGRLDVHLFVLISPCNYGRCVQTDIWTLPCNDSSRAFSFDAYKCICKAGYHTQWCDEEIDECADDPCSSMFDCTDHVGFYTCHINAGYLAAVLLSSAFAVLSAGIIIAHRYKNLKKDRLLDSRMWMSTGDEWNQRLTSGLRQDSAVQNHTDGQGEPPPFIPPDEKDPFQSISRTMFNPLQNIRLENQLGPGMLRKPSEQRHYQSMFKPPENCTNTSQYSDMATVDI